MTNQSAYPVLSPSKLNRILKRFTASSIHPKPYLTQAFQSPSSTIATNSHMVLFLSNQIVNESITNTLIDQEGIASLTQLESNFLTQSNFDPSTQLTLDSQLLSSIVKSLKQHQSDLHTKQTKTVISYHERTNELILSTIPNKPQTNFNPKEYVSFFRPASVGRGRDMNFSLAVSTNFLLSALISQQEIDVYTLLNHSFTKNYLQLENTYSTIVLMALK